MEHLNFFYEIVIKKALGTWQFSKKLRLSRI